MTNRRYPLEAPLAEGNPVFDETRQGYLNMYGERLPDEEWTPEAYLGLAKHFETPLHRPRCESKNRVISSWYSLTSGAVMSLMYWACD
jgi:hypothetical protein